ncbi:hypothetical protein RRF57_009571 [Xylaria bambusicola]|uniref:Uncharacterized protein n=1 Tax=Xylaria bambusicola TaxID=326684 RepID=A0AAN7Z7Y1_9PEZI
MELEHEPLIEARVGKVPVEPGPREGGEIVSEHDEVVGAVFGFAGGGCLQGDLQAVASKALGTRPAHEDGDMAD